MKPVETLYLDRGPGNPLDHAGLRALLADLRRLENSCEVRVIVLASRNRSVFSSGLALRSLTAHGRLRTAWSVVSAVLLVRRVVGHILRSSKMIFAIVRGGVIGSAVSIALACDRVLADSSAWFWLPDPVYGGLLADGGLDLLRERIGLTRAQEICLPAGRISSVQALEMGLIHCLEKPKNLDSVAFEDAQRLCRLSEQTLRQTKRLLGRRILTPAPLFSLIRSAWSGEMRRRTQDALRL